MKFCPACTTMLDKDEDARCVKCGISFANNPAIDSDELARRVKTKHRGANRWLFIASGAVLSSVPCLMFGAGLERWALGLVLAAASSALMYYKINSNVLSMLVYAVPQIACSGINFFAWLAYIVIGYALGLWKLSMRDLQ